MAGFIVSPFTGQLDLKGDGGGGTGQINSVDVINIPPSVLAELGTADNLAAVLSELTERSKVYEFTQPTPSTTWGINHQLGTEYPSITVIDDTGSHVIGYELNPIDEDTLQVIFCIPFAGIASLNR